MHKILDLLEEQTGGKCYTSYQYRFDAMENPSIKYEEVQDYKLEPKRHGETDSLKTIKSLSGRAKQVEGNPLFRYFLDGSRRIYKVDDIEINKKIFPIMGGQIGVACCERQSPSTFRRAVLEHSLVISLPSEADKDGRNSEQFFNLVTQKINNLSKVEKFNLHFSKILSYGTKLEPNEKYEDKGAAKIQDEMIECEKKIVNELAKKHLLNPDSYLLKDGSLQYQKTGIGDFRELSKFKSNYQCVIGVSKTFNPALDGNTKNASVIAKLPAYHRTPAFYYYGSRSQHAFSIWYVRIRDFKNHRPDSPFSGIVKVEKVLVTDDELENGLNSDEIDLISANLINERNPVAYGNDARWANHLYPVYLTESFVKSQYISDLHFLNLF
jgi:hypothetical protein